MVPASEDGAITGTTLARPVLPVSVLLDGQNAVVEYAGSAPGEVAGVLQVNILVPPGAKSGDVILHIGGNDSQKGVTVAIR